MSSLTDTIDEYLSQPVVNERALLGQALMELRDANALRITLERRVHELENEVACLQN